MAINYIYWKRPTEKKYKKLGIAFKDSDYAIFESTNILRRGLDVKIKANGKYWFDSKKLEKVI